MMSEPRDSSFYQEKGVVVDISW